MAAPHAEFTDTFAAPKDNYGDFIRLVRKNVIKYCTDKPNVYQPVLPAEKKIPEKWFHVALKTAATTSPLTLAIRMDNLYLVGFKTPGPAGVWWEFNNEKKTHLLGKDAKWLGFSGHYQDLVGQKGLETVTLGRDEMIAAVDLLASHGTATNMPEEALLGDLLASHGTATNMPEEALLGDPYARPKSMLAKLVIMVCEGIRFNTVYGTVDKEFKHATGGAKITELEGKQVNKWDRISKAVLEWAVHPDAKFPELEKLDVKNKSDAAKIVALVKNETS